MYEDDKTDKDVAVEKVDIKGCEVSNLLKGSYNKPTSHRGPSPTTMKEKVIFSSMNSIDVLNLASII